MKQEIKTEEDLKRIFMELMEENKELKSRLAEVKSFCDEQYGKKVDSYVG